MIRITTLALALIAAILTAGAANAATALQVNHSAVTAVSKHPDSGSQGNNWALDNFSRTATLHLVGPVSLADCAGVPAHCYEFTGTITDAGHFTTIAGQKSPGVGDGGNQLLYEAITGSMSGHGSYQFYSSWKTADRLPAASVSGKPTSYRRTTGDWVLQFFRLDGPQFWGVSGQKITRTGGTALLNDWSWSYDAPAGADHACPSAASHWVDAYPDAGAKAVDGNVLAPDVAHC